MRRPPPLAIVLLSVVCTTATTVRAEVPLVYATLEPKTLTLGDSALLTITNLSATPVPVTVPTVAGLQFELLGQRRQLEMNGGTSLTSTATLIKVTPQIAGVFSIPAVTPKTPALILQVNADHGPANANNPANSNYLIRPPVLPNAPKTAGLHMTADGSAFVKLNLPKRAIYVGESVPIDIVVGMRNGFVTSMNGLPTMTGGEFTLNNLSRKPERDETTIDSKRYILLTWHSVLAAIKPGNFALGIETPLTVKISTRSKQDAAIDDLLGDPFLQNFYGASISREITVASPPFEVTVLPLPTEGRPDDFHGAVGSFKIATDLTPSSVAAGDPMTLRLRVTGSGTFDRVDSSMLAAGDTWKTYPPKSSFSPSDALGYGGEKKFEQPVIATRSGAQTMPGLSFSYFDPSARRYQTARSASIAVNVTPSPGALHAANDGATAGSREVVLRPDHPLSDAVHPSLVPLYLQPRFMIGATLLAAAWTSGLLLLRRRSVPRTRPLKGVLAKLNAAASARNAPLFLDLARNALQTTLARRWQTSAEQITPREIEARLGANGADLVQLFALADEYRYAAGERALDWERWLELLRTHLSSPA